MEEKDITNSPIEPETENLTESVEQNKDAEIQDTDKMDEILSVSLTEKLHQETQEQKEKYIRLLAEFENYKRRTSKERIDLISSASKEVLISFLDVLDDCERAEKNLTEDTNIPQNQKEGILLVFNKFKNLMSSKGVKEMECTGEFFDVEKHEAITEIETKDDLKGKVVDVLIKGYYLNDKIIRYAKVVLGK